MNWDLSKLYAGFDDERLHADLAEAFAKTADLQRSIVALSDDSSADALTAVIEDMKTVADLQTKVGSFTFLTLSVDSNCEPARAFYERSSSSTSNGSRCTAR